MAQNKENIVNDEDEIVKEEEIEAAKEEAENTLSLFTIHFKKAITYNGKEYEELSFDFDTLTGADGLNIENELQSIGRPAVVPAFSGEYLIRMAAKACTTDKIGSDIFNIMRLSDYNKIRSAARSFLLRSE